VRLLREQQNHLELLDQSLVDGLLLSKKNIQKQ